MRRIVHVGIDGARQEDLNASGQREQPLAGLTLTVATRRVAPRLSVTVSLSPSFRRRVDMARAAAGVGLPSPKLQCTNDAAVVVVRTAPSNITLNGAAPLVGVTVNAGCGGTVATFVRSPPEPPPPQPDEHRAKLSVETALRRAHGGKVSHMNAEISVARCATRRRVGEVRSKKARVLPGCAQPASSTSRAD